MRNKRLLLLALLTLFVAVSCSIEKRVYNKGFHVDWKKNYKSQNVAVEKASLDETSESPFERNIIKLPVKVNQNLEKVESSEQKLIITRIEKETSLESSSVSYQSESNNLLARVRENSIVDEISENTPKKKSEIMNSSADSGGKSQVVALILVLLVGVIGVHRFYLGYTGIGILMILTVGCCGILALIDLIRIITGDLKPRNGEYSEKL
jgi:TM2 domain-containing membrane protein YozV